MKELSVLSGIANHVNIVSSTAGGASIGVSTSHCLQFRVDNRPAWFEGAVNVVEGEHVTVVGHAKNEFHAVALRNDLTQIVYRTHTVRERGLAKGVLGFGILFGCFRYGLLVY